MARLGTRQYLHRRGNVWHLWLPVPPDMQAAEGKPIVRKSLATDDHQKAQEQRDIQVGEYREKWRRLREGGALTGGEVQVLRDRAYALAYEEAQRLRDQHGLSAVGDHVEHLQDTYYAPAEDDDGREVAIPRLRVSYVLLHGTVEHEAPWLARAADALRAFGRPATGGNVERVAEAMLEAERAAYQHVADRREPEVKVEPVPRTSRGALTVAAWVEEYLAQRVHGWTAQTRAQNAATLRLFASEYGDLPLSDVTRRETAAFIDKLNKLDPQWPRHAEVKDATLADLLAAYPAPPGGGLSLRTLRRHAGALVGMFKRAIAKHLYTAGNPASAIVDPTVHGRPDDVRPGGGQEGDAEDKRRPFTTRELNALLSGKLFDVSARQRIRPKAFSAQTALLWLIPVALFTGCRMEELAGMRVEDVRDAEAVPHLKVVPHKGRRLKTKAAERDIPIHAELVAMGFLDYVAHVRRRGEAYLFPNLLAGGVDKRMGQYLGRRFRAYRHAVGVTDPATPFHAFRNTMATALENGGASEHGIAQVLGHEKKSLGTKVYSDGLGLPQLRKVVAAVRYPGVSLKHLRMSS